MEIGAHFERAVEAEAGKSKSEAENEDDAADSKQNEATQRSHKSRIQHPRRFGNSKEGRRGCQGSERRSEDAERHEQQCCCDERNGERRVVEHHGYEGQQAPCLPQRRSPHVRSDSRAAVGCSYEAIGGIPAGRAA